MATERQPLFSSMGKKRFLIRNSAGKRDSRA